MPMPRQRAGQRIAILGVLALIICMMPAVGDLWDDTPCPARAAAPQDQAGIVYAGQSEFHLNGRLCVAVRGEKFFASERADLDTAVAAMKKAGNDLIQAEADLVQAGQEPDPAKKQKSEDDARKRVGEMQKQLDTAKTAVSSRSTTRTVALFIDDVRTPVVMDLYVSDPQSRGRRADLDVPQARGNAGRKL